jgi:hypothetical protein
MKIFSLSIVFGSLFLLFAPQLFAATDLYSAEVAVADTSPEARKASVRQAFEKVLIKVSGHRNLAGRNGVKELLESAEGYVQQFRYRSQASEDEEEPEKRWMWVAFEKTAVQNALQNIGLSSWEKGRPEVLLWMAQDREGRRRLLDQEKDAAVVQALKTTANQRGLPLLLPIMDLEDQSALRVSDVWTIDQERIEKASARYGEQLVLVGRLRQSGAQWTSKWTLFIGDRQKKFSSVGGGVEATVSAGINKVMDWMADQFVPAGDANFSEAVMLRVLGVQGLPDYYRLMRLLESLDVVSSYAVQEVSGDQLLIQTKVRGGRDILKQRLSLEAALTPVASVPDNESLLPGDMELSYRLR